MHRKGVTVLVLVVLLFGVFFVGASVAEGFDLNDYTNQNGVVDDSGVEQAVEDFNSGNISLAELQIVSLAYERGFGFDVNIQNTSMQNGDLAVQVGVTSIYTGTETKDVTLTDFNGVQQDTETLTLNSAETSSVEIFWTNPDQGTGDIVVSDESGNYQDAINVTIEEDTMNQIDEGDDEEKGINDYRNQDEEVTLSYLQDAIDDYIAGDIELSMLQDVIQGFLLEASFTVSSDTPSTSNDITFDASGSTDSAQKYEWEFGDGTTATGEAVTKSYSDADEYDATLTITDDNGNKARATNTITVEDQVSPLKITDVVISGSSVDIDVEVTRNSVDWQTIVLSESTGEFDDRESIGASVGDTVTKTFSFDNIDDGTYTVEAKILEDTDIADSRDISIGGSGFNINIDLEKSEISIGETNRAYVSVENIGTSDETVEVEVFLLAGGFEREDIFNSQSTTIPAQGTEEYEVEFGDSEEYDDYAGQEVSIVSRVNYGSGSSEFEDDFEPLNIEDEVPEILDVSQEPNAAETGEDVEVSIEAENADTGQLEYSVNGGTSESIPFDISGGTATATIPGDNHEPGNKITYDVTVDGPGGSASENDFNYFSFETVEDVAVVYAKFDDSGEEFYDDENGEYIDVPEPIEEDPNDLQSTQERIQYMTNEYMSGWRGSRGIVGYDFDFYDNGSSWYTIASAQNLISNVRENDNGIVNIYQAFNLGAFGQVNEVDTDSKFNSNYDAAVAIAPGTTTELDDIGAEGRYLHISTTRNGGSSRLVSEVSIPEREGDDEEYRLQTEVWIHELGHTIGYEDLYLTRGGARVGGEIGLTGMMGGGTVPDQEITPFSTVSRTEFHVSDVLEGRSGWPWLETTDPYLDGYPLIEVESLRGLDPDTYEVPVHNPPNSNDFVPINSGDIDNINLVLGARGKNQAIPRRTDVDRFEKGVYIYIVAEKLDAPDEIYLAGNWGWNDFVGGSDVTDATLHTQGDGREEINLLPSYLFVTYELESEEGSGEDYRAEVNAMEPDDDAEATYVYSVIADVADLEEDELVGLPEKPENFRSPDIRLRATDAEGRSVGFDEDSREYNVDIPGVKQDHVSGNQRAIEWIGTPQNKSVLYEVDTGGIEEWMNWLRDEYNVSEDDINTSTNATIVLDSYDEGVEFNETTGEIDNSTTITQSISLESNETTAIGSSAIVDFEPDTFNKQSRGRWVNVSIDIPHSEINTTDVNLSSVRLNDKVAPVTNERYGFVRNAVKNGTLTMKFSRDEVSEVLEVGENITILVTGETENQELLVGMDKTRVIKRPPGDEAPDCSPDEGRGPPNGTPGQGPPDEIPGEGPGDGPGERIGPPNGTPGQGPPDEIPGRGPPDCQEGDGDEHKDENDDVGEDEPQEDGRVDDRRDAGRGENPPRNDRGEVSRGDPSNDERRGSSDRRRSRGR